MSKHQKEVRRERRQAEAGRRRSLLKSQASSLRSGGAAALAAAAAIASGTAAYAEPIRFDNPAGPGHFEWTQLSNPFGLDILQPADAQPGDLSVPGVAGVALVNPYGNTFFSCSSLSGVALQAGGLYDYFVVGVARHTLIPSGFAWNDDPYVYYAGLGSEIPMDTQTYLGVRFDLGSGWQYGWIGAQRLSATNGSLDAFAWGYETEPGVPIAAGVPEPGSLALLAIGAAGALSRRRRD